MKKTQIIQEEEPVEQEEAAPEGNTVSQTSDIGSPVSHESAWGAVLFACMLLFVVVSVGSVGWMTYREWQDGRATKKQPSISAWSEQIGEEKKTSSAEPAPDTVKTNEPVVDDASAAAKKAEVSVLNGGAAKGSAGILATFLKQEGFSKTDSGNTAKDYIGVAVYYTTGLDKEAAVVKGSVAKKYPQVKLFPADAKNKETSVSQITIILGK